MKRFPIRLPNLSLSVIEEGGSRFFTLFTIYTCTCNAATIFWVTAGPSLNMEAAPVLPPLTTSQLCMRRGP